MLHIFLQLNQENTEIFILGTKILRKLLNEKLGSLASYTKPEVQSLGVILHSELCFNKHVNAVTKVAFYHLINIAKVEFTVMLFLLGFLRKQYIFYNP